MFLCRFGFFVGFVDDSIEFRHKLEESHIVKVGEIALCYDVFPLLVFVDLLAEEAKRRHSECILLSSSHIAE